MTDDLKNVDPSKGQKVTNRQVTMSLRDAIEIGQKNQRNGHLLNAEQVYRKILESKPDQPEALHFLGVVLHQKGQYDEGIELILAALEIDPGYIDAFNNLGNVLKDFEFFEQAEAAYRRAIELKPDFPEAHLNLAALLYELKRFEEALVESQLALELLPELTESNVTTGKMFASQGRHADAAEAFLRGMERKQFKANVHENMANSLIRLGRVSEAEEIYHRWIRLEPENPRPRHHLAGCTGRNVPVRASNEYVISIFDRFSQSFDHCLTRLKYSAPKLVIEAIEVGLGSSQAELVILDAGCGTGLCGAGARPFARRLIGVDLSSKMLEKARERQIYDELCECELTEYLCKNPVTFDVIVSADTLVYFGDLQPVVTAAANALRPDGRLIFTVEKADPAIAPNGFVLETHGRYGHTDCYVRSVIEQSGLEISVIRENFMRKELGQDVIGWLVVARAPGGNGK